MEVLLLLTLGAMIGWGVAKYMYMTALLNLIERLGITEDQLREVAEEMGVEVPEKEKQTIEVDGEEYEYEQYVEVRVEKEGKNLYAYEDETDRFIVQNTDPKELIEDLINHYPPKTRVNIDPNNGGKYFKKVVDNS